MEFVNERGWNWTGHSLEELVVRLVGLCRQFSQLVYPCRRSFPLGMELRLFGFGFVVWLVQLAKKVDRYRIVVEGIVMLISQKDIIELSVSIGFWALYPVWFGCVLLFTWSCGWSRWNVLWAWCSSRRIVVVLGITCHNQGTNQLKNQTNKDTNWISNYSDHVHCFASIQTNGFALIFLFAFAFFY